MTQTNKQTNERRERKKIVNAFFTNYFYIRFTVYKYLCEWAYENLKEKNNERENEKQIHRSFLLFLFFFIFGCFFSFLSFFLLPFFDRTNWLILCINVCYLFYRWNMTTTIARWICFLLIRFYSAWLVGSRFIFSTSLIWNLSVNTFGIYMKGKFSTCYAHWEHTFVFIFVRLLHFLLWHNTHTHTYTSISTGYDYP